VDGKFVHSGRRLAQVSVLELLNFVYADLLSWADQDGRKKVNAALEGKIGSGGGVVIDDPSLPASMQGMEAPSWWDDDEDPFADQHTLNNVVTR